MSDLDHTDAAKKISGPLDDAIRQQYGAHKMQANTMSPSQTESLAPGSDIAPGPSVTSSSAAGSPDSHAPHALAKDSPVHSSTVEAGETGGGRELVTSMRADRVREVLEQLVCQVCRRMDASGPNRLIECVDCHALYHQRCHKPIISHTEAGQLESIWCCSGCKKKRVAAVAAVAAVASVTTAVSPAKSADRHFRRPSLMVSLSLPALSDDQKKRFHHHHRHIKSN